MKVVRTTSAQSHSSMPMSRPDGCTCQYGEMTPVWYASVRTCKVHGGNFDSTDRLPGFNAQGVHWMDTVKPRKRTWWRP